MRRGLAIAVAVAVLATPFAHAATGDIEEFDNPTAGGAPLDAVLGPDGNFWFTDYSKRTIGRVTPSGAIRDFSVPSGPMGIAPGPDGNLWFTESASGRIGRMSTSGRLLGEYIIPTPNSYPQGIAFGPDGNMWFTERSANKIGRITTAGRFTEFAVPQSSPWGLASGPDGNIWVALSGSDRIARVTPRGHITEFQVPNAATHPISVAAGPDGNVWFSEEFPTYQIGRITPSGAITEFPLPSSDSDADSLVAGPDGAVWFGDGGSGKIGRIGTDGTITEFPVPGSSVPEGIAVGSDQNIWFTDNRANKIGRLLIDPATTTPAPPVFANAIDATVVGGEVTVQVPGSTHFEPLTRPEQVHVGATIDARAGRVRIVIVDARGKTWTADFYGGVFKITQLAAEGGVAQLALTGGHFAACVRTGRSAIAAAQRKRSAKSIRHLWASGSGPFRTLGHYASAAIRGTTWDTDDRCDGTLVKVKQGSVTVRDLVRKKTVVVRAHGQYLAKVR